MKKIVADASVILKWVLPDTNEKDVEAALQLREMAIDGQIMILAPTLLLFEVGNILTIKEPTIAEKMIQQIMSFQLYERPWTNAWLSETLALTKKYKVTFYDAAYHALALTEAAVFVTGDSKYVNKTEAVGNVVLLSNWRH